MTLPDRMRRKPPSEFITGCAIAVFPSDVAYDIEFKRAPDSGGNPDEGNSEIIDTIPGNQQVFTDHQALGSEPWHYCARHTRAGETASAWTPYIQLDPRRFIVALRPPPILPTADEQPTDNGAAGTLTVAVTDPQNRLTKVEFKNKSGSADEEAAWTEDATPPYTYNVDLDVKHPSHIRYRLTYYDDYGNEVTRERTVSFGLATKPAKPAVTLNMDSSGNITAHIEGDQDTDKVRAKGSISAYPNEAAVDAETPISGSSVDTGTLVTLSQNETAYVSVRAYTAGESGSELAMAQLTAIPESVNDPPSDPTGVILTVTRSRMAYLD